MHGSAVENQGGKKTKEKERKKEKPFVCGL
jgi:hypothetical protein